MRLDPQSSLALYKVNLQFYFRLCDLLRENGLRWAAAGRDTFEACATDFEHAATRTLDAGDWKAVGFVAGDLYWKALQQQTQALQRFAETVVANQTGFATALQDAVASWQKEAAAALQESAGAMPISAMLQSWLEPPAPAPTPAPAPAGRRASVARLR
jgi:hypothetical protein